MRSRVQGLVRGGEAVLVNLGSVVYMVRVGVPMVHAHIFHPHTQIPTIIRGIGAMMDQQT